MSIDAVTAPRSLAEELRGWSDERLSGLLVARPDLASPVPPDMGVLAALATVRLSVLRAIEQLPAFLLALLDALVLSDTTTPYADLVTLVGSAAPADDLRAGVETLRGLALLWGTDAELHVVGAVREVVGQHPAGLGRPLAACLSRHSDRQVAPVAEAYGVQGLPGLSALFADPERLGPVLAGLGPEERTVLATLAAGPPLGQVRDALRHDAPDSPVRRLLARGLLIPVDNATVELPREVGLLLRGDAPLGKIAASSPALVTSSPSGVDQTAAHAAVEATTRVEALLEEWAREPAAVLRAGGLGVRELKRAAVAIDADERAAALIIEIAAGAGLVDQTPGVDPLWAPTPAYDTWLALPPELRWIALARSWLALTRLPRLVGERGDRDKVLAALSPEIERTAAPADRRRVLDLLAEAGKVAAPTVASVEAVLAWRAPRRGGRLRDVLPSWVLAEAEAIGLTGRGAVSSFARVLLSGDDRGAAKGLGALIPDPLDHVLVQPDLTVVAPGPLERDLARELALVADVESTGGATVYRVSETSVRRALDAGRAASDLHELFRSRSRTPIPQSLTYLIDDISRRHGRMRVGTAASYLRCDDEALLSEVLSAKKVTPLGLRRLAPTVLTSSAPVTQVLEVLRELGYAP
ncbi:MAG: helicase-associated domain-containing protein, partial [Mycobacteriales bacterium]